MTVASGKECLTKLYMSLMLSKSDGVKFSNLASPCRRLPLEICEHELLCLDLMGLRIRSSKTFIELVKKLGLANDAGVLRKDEASSPGSL